MTPVECSVVIVTYRCRDLVLDCLADLHVARAAIGLEVIVVDNASGDGTTDAIRTEYPWVDVEDLPKNLGFARANNRGIRRAHADAVLMLNPDTRIDATGILTMLDALAAEPAVGILGPRVVDERGRVDLNCRRGFPTILGIAGALTHLDRVVAWQPLGEYRLAWVPADEPTDVVSLSGSVMLARRAALTDVGGFDERFFMYGEDIDLCIRIARAGWHVRHVPRATVIHLGGGSPPSPETRRAWARAIGRVHRIHRPGLRGWMSGAVCDAAGTLLTVAARLRRSREAQPLNLNSSDTRVGR